MYTFSKGKRFNKSDKIMDIGPGSYKVDQFATFGPNDSKGSGVFVSKVKRVFEEELPNSKLPEYNINIGVIIKFP